MGRSRLTYRDARRRMRQADSRVGTRGFSPLSGTLRKASLLIVIVGLAGCGAATSGASPDLTPTDAPLNQTIEATGQVVPAQWTTLSFTGGGRLVEVAEVGDEVIAGEILARLDTAELDLAVAQAGAALDGAQVRLDQAQDALDLAELTRDRAALRAPFAGTVTDVLVRDEQVVGPGTPVLVLGDLTTLRVETTDLNEADVTRIAVGDTATVTFDALPGVAIAGRVVSIAPMAEPGIGVNYTLVVELDELPEGLRWGMTAYLSFDVSGEMQ